MGLEYTHVCDGCGKVVSGYDKAALTTHDHIQMRGTILLQIFGDDGYREHIYATRPPTQDLTFCLKKGLPCLESYLRYKKKSYEERKKNGLEARASEEHIERLELGGFNRAPRDKRPAPPPDSGW